MTTETSEPAVLSGQLKPDSGAPGGPVDDDLARAVIDAGDFLPCELRDRVVSQRRAAVPTLLALLRGHVTVNDEYGDLEWARLHAVDMLRDIDDPSTIEPLLELLISSEPGDVLHDRLIFALVSLGEDVLEPALEAQAKIRDPGILGAIAVIVARLGVRDERIFPLLVEHLARDCAEGAICLADYGDPRAIEHLHKAFDDYEPVAADPLVPPEHTLFAIESSLKRLGSDLSPEQRRKYQELESSTYYRTALTQAPPASAAYATPTRRSGTKKQRTHSKKKRKQQRVSRKKNR